MVVFIKVCSVHTPSSNPRKPPALKITETLRRPIKKVCTLKINCSQTTNIPFLLFSKKCSFMFLFHILILSKNFKNIHEFFNQVSTSKII